MQSYICKLCRKSISPHSYWSTFTDFCLYCSE